MLVRAKWRYLSRSPCSSLTELVVFLYWSYNSTNNLWSYFALLMPLSMSASDKEKKLLTYSVNSPVMMSLKIQFDNGCGQRNRGSLFTLRARADPKNIHMNNILDIIFSLWTLVLYCSLNLKRSLRRNFVCSSVIM